MRIRSAGLESATMDSDTEAASATWAASGRLEAEASGRLRAGSVAYGNQQADIVAVAALAATAASCAASL